MRRIAFINEKGGTCKTTLAVNLAAYFSKKKGLSTLLVDLDTQGHAGKSLGIDVRGLKPNAFHWLCEQRVRLEEVIHPTSIPKLFVVPSYKEMSQFPTVLGNDPRRTRRLSDALQAANLSPFDLVIFDSPPSLGLTTLNILLASTEVIVPVALTYFALDGCAEMVDTVRRVAEEHGRTDLAISLVVPTLHRHTTLAEEILAKLKSYFPRQLAKTSLAFNVKIDEAQSHGKTIWEYQPSSRGAQMLAAIAEEVLAAQPAAPERSAGSAVGSPVYAAPDRF